MKDKLTVLVNTCDKYEFLWPDFKNLFDKNFPTELNLDVCLLSQSKTSSLFNKCFTPGPIEFSKAIEYALNKIDTPYILWLQDDYFFTDKLTGEEMQQYIDLCIGYKMDRLGICEDSKYYSHTKVLNETNLYKFNLQSSYTLSLQASIFRKDWLINIVKGKDWTPWETELCGTLEINKINKQDKLSNIYMVERYFYSEAMRKGNETNFYKEFKKNKLI
tara:strand:- start:617 stop:1270 length:654 start_codon:yes stop_codon:yes gene_type:complete